MKYKGFDCEPSYYGKHWLGTDPDFDADFVDGEYVQCGGKPTQYGKSLESVKEAIDEYYLEQAA